MPRPDPETRATFLRDCSFRFPRSESEDSFAGKFDVSGFVSGGEGEAGALFAFGFEKLRDRSFAADFCAELQ